MIRILGIEVSGQAEVGAFRGGFAFGRGLQVVSAHNHYGKSLAATGIAWCLGVERIFGLNDNDPSRFPVAVREAIDLGADRESRVLSSAATVQIERKDGARISLTRPIVGDPSQVTVTESDSSGSLLKSQLNARKLTMKDESGGLQHFLFKWLGLPREPVLTTRADLAEVYLENLVPLFFIDQSEGWTDIQALQVFRYGQIDITQIAVEHLLGATAAIKARFSEHTFESRQERLKGKAAGLAAEVCAVFARQGWTLEWSSRGTLADIVKRWSSRKLSEVARVEYSFDHVAESVRLSARINALRETLGVRALDPSSTAAASDTSQNVVDLKTQRHKLRERLRLARSQLDDQQALLDTLEHRIHSTKDLLRLKSAGLGRLRQVECPTCHRTVEAATLQLGTRSQESVSAHIEALERDRALVSMNRDATAADATAVAAELSRVEVALQSAERALAAVTVAVGPEREQLAKAALDLVAAEREFSQNAAIAKELEEFQAAVDAWISEASSEAQELVDKGDIGRRVQAFEARLDELLRALGHSAVISGQQRVRLDDYVPYLGARRLRSLGSASDHARLVAAYSLALAAASEEVHGPHPGIVVLDEPLQQNPDPVHRDLFLKFLESAAASRLKQQVLVFTSLSDTELARLQASGVAIHNPREEHLLHRTEVVEEA